MKAMKQKSIKISCTDLDLILLRKIFEYIYFTSRILYIYTSMHMIFVYAYIYNLLYHFNIRVNVFYINLFRTKILTITLDNTGAYYTRVIQK